VIRKGVAKPMVFNVVRDIVEVDIVRAEVLPGGVGYLSLAEFNDQSDHKVEKALATLKAKNVRGLILDLRWNPGGLLDQAVNIASRFIPRGPVVWIKERGGKPESQDTVRQRLRVGDIPVVVLVNKYSASASEIVAGAIKDTHSGTVVGMTTWGKGLVQTINPIPTDNSAVLITTHRYYTPNMVDINHKGIVPDIEADVTEKDFAKYEKTRKLMDDPQVVKALQVVQTKMAE
jgi:carboxyl-terminal processing protease